MITYFGNIITEFVKKHTSIKLLQSVEGDKQQADCLASAAASIWDRKCDAEMYLKEWKRQNNTPEVEQTEFHEQQPYSGC